MMSANQPVPLGRLHRRHKTFHYILLGCNLVNSDNPTKTISHTISCDMYLSAEVHPDWTHGLTRVWDKKLPSVQRPRGWRSQKPKNDGILSRKPSDLSHAMWGRLDPVCCYSQVPALNQSSFHTKTKVPDQKVYLPTWFGMTSSGSSTSETTREVLRSIAVTTVRMTEKEKTRDESGRDADDRKSDERKRCRGVELLTCSLSLSAAGAESADFLPSKRRRSRAGREGGRGRGRRKSDATWEKNLLWKRGENK